MPVLGVHGQDDAATPGPAAKLRFSILLHFGFRPSLNSDFRYQKPEAPRRALLRAQNLPAHLSKVFAPERRAHWTDPHTWASVAPQPSVIILRKIFNVCAGSALDFHYVFDQTPTWARSLALRNQT